MHWDSDSCFRIALPTRPVATDLIGEIRANSPASPGRIDFGLEVHRRTVMWMVATNLACAVIGPWSTELFIEIYSWWWQPPLCVLAALWVGWKWPVQALADAREIAPRWIDEIRSRVGVEAASTTAAT